MPELSSSPMEILNIVTQAANKTREQVLNATREDLDDLLEDVMDDPDAMEQLQRRGIRTLEDLRKQVEVARQSLGKDAQAQGKQETAKNTTERAQEDKQNEAQKAWWKDFVVEPKNIPLIGKIPVLGFLASVLATPLTAKPIEGIFTKLGFPTIGKVARWTTVAAAAGATYYFWPYIKGYLNTLLSAVPQGELEIGMGRDAPIRGVDPPVSPVPDTPLPGGGRLGGPPGYVPDDLLPP